MEHAPSPSRATSRPVSLRFALTLPFVALIVLSCGLVGFFSLWDGREAVLDVAGQLRSEVLKRVEDHLTGFLDLPRKLNEANAQALRAGVLDLSDPVRRARYFHGVVAANPRIAYSFIGLPDGEFHGARRNEAGEVEVIHAGRDTGQASTYFSTSPLGDPLEFRAAYPNFDPRARPWYKSGVQAGKAVWSPVYRHFVLKDLTLTASLPVHDGKGGLVGVFGVDYALGNIHEFLRTIKVGNSGEVFLMERGGELLASSTMPPSLFLVPKGEGFERLRADQAPRPRVAAAARRLEALPGGLAGIAEDTTLEFDMDGQSQFLQATPFTDPMGVDWLIVAVAPASDFLGRIDANTRQTLALILAAAFLATLAGVVLAGLLTRPVERLAQAADGLSQGRWNLDVKAPGVRELDRLARAFSRMAGQLLSSFEELRAKGNIIAAQNRTLEERVARRTAELAHLHHRLRAIFEAIPGYIHVIDREFRVVDVCDKMLAAVGLTREEVLGRRCHEVFQGLESICGHCALCDDDSRDRTSIRPSTPTEEGILGHAFMAYSAPIRDQQGSVWGYIECLMDVSALRAAEQELLAAKEQADAANRAKSAFLANMSHELRTPMNGILGVLQLLKTTPLDQEQSGFVETGEAVLKNLLGLINDILDLSKVEAGKLDLVESRVDLEETCRFMAGLFRGQAQAKGLALDFHVASGVPGFVLADASRLRQVLFNLIGNALKFTEKGGVRLLVESAGPAPQGRTLLRFTVADTGIGIPEARQDDLFKPFVQIDGALDKKYPGTGLGLSIVKRLVELMEGEVTVESEPGRGTRVRFEIPVLAAPPEAPGASAARPESEGGADAPARSLDVLLVDDEPVNRRVMQNLLEKRGHRVVLAETGLQALEQLARRPFDCVLMDVQMPGMDGLAATRAIRANERQAWDASVSVIALTAHAMAGDRERFLAEGMDDYLSKPVELEALDQVLGRVARRRGPS
ncbi:Autoinducer 2 sensor kinase/phosphatase LuxQ [Fundidesulfovibrio magnetotacticus]|uniref:Sensory/regulatory protein RpfC n=1 Tax=Fundidesulfovibrio magnetotacticus TaxID=2730080 RepID=A0A6V8LI98_9BACT|nr:response regulator [Fundidesulfovibrio magnetotacticus]GFK92462.1 Autoinducer 2 sensor kinase/phosphatase LuxQ [Fundidesulfovibrio magnetotacticus]